MASFPSLTQLDAMDCGPTCLRMVSRFYGRSYSLQSLRERCHITREGVSLLGISDAAESIGFRTTGVKITWEQLRDEMPMPCIVHWNQRHFVVVYGVIKWLLSDERIEVSRLSSKLRLCYIRGDSNVLNNTKHCISRYKNSKVEDKLYKLSNNISST